MRYDKTDTFLSTAFGVIKQYDPATYARMVRDKWTVTTDSLIPMLLGAFGVTQSAPNQGGIGSTELDPEEITRWAKANGVRPELFAATVLVHEYAHDHQRGRSGLDHEIPAFRSGSAFASLLPEPDRDEIKRESDRTLSEIEAGKL